jgi:hypothetical protein
MLTRKAAMNRKIGGDHLRHGPELGQFGIEKRIGHVILAVIGAGAAMRLQDRVEAGDDVLRVGIARKGQRNIVERPLHVIGCFKHRSVHVNDAETLLVGHHVAGPDGIDILRRQGDAGDRKRAFAPVDQHIECVARAKAVRLGKGFDDRGFIVAARFGKPAGTQIETVDRRFAVVGHRDHHARRRLGHAGDVDDHRIDDARRHRGNTVDRCDLGFQAFRRPRRRRKDVCEAGAVVERCAGIFKRPGGAQCQDQGHDPAGHDQRDGKRLCPQPAEIAQQLAIEHAQPVHQLTSDGLMRSVLSSHEAIWPSRNE